MWRVAGISASSGAFNYNMTLTQNEGTVSGVAKSEDMKIEGTYDGATFTFTQDMDGKINTCSAERTSEKMLQGTYTSSSGGTGQFSCSKKK
jgi:hypothetical protein